MGRANGASRGRVAASRRSSAQKAAQARGLATCQKGDVGEGAFLHKALGLGFTVAMPFGHAHRYDFIVNSGKNLWRVQVKACARLNHGLYDVHARTRVNGVRQAYAESELDFLAAYIIPEDTWYILPAHQVAGHGNLSFRPKGFPRRDLYAYYREAWHLMREPDGLTF